MASARNSHLRRADAFRVETAAEREARLRRERKMLDEAQNELDAGLGLEGAEVEAWLDRLDSDDTHPPESKRKPTHGT